MNKIQNVLLQSNDCPLDTHESTRDTKSRLAGFILMLINGSCVDKLTSSPKITRL
jgi:hypothetical protein